MADRFEAVLDDFTLDVETIDDSIEKSIGRQEFPYRDGALLDDMGQKARTIRIRCYFYNATYEDHKAFINHLEKKDLFEFSHPQYGLIKGCVETVFVRHDDRLETAEVDISFVEALRGQIAVGEVPPSSSDEMFWADPKGAAEESFVPGQDLQIESLTEDMMQDCEELGLGGLPTSMAQDLNPDEDIIDQFTAIAGKTRQYVKELSNIEKTLKGYLSPGVIPVNSIISQINYGVKLPGRIINTAARTAERYARILDTIRTAPALFLKSLGSSLGNMEVQIAKLESSVSSFGGSAVALRARQRVFKQVKSACAMRMGLEAGEIYKEDQEKRQAQKTSGRSFDLNGNFLRTEAPEPIMNVRELEESLAVVRSYLQEATDAAREVEAPRDMADALLRHVSQIKIDRDRLMKVRLDNEMPVHLVCLKYALPYKMADRILAVNNIKNPNFTGGEINIYSV